VSASLEAKVVGLCRELVRLDSLSGREQRVAELVSKEMRELGYDHVETDELGNVVGILGAQTTQASAAFDAHMDVVPVSDAPRWTHEPFSAELAEGCVWGRGTTDVKGSLAALVVGLGLLPRGVLQGTVVVSASVGEEAVEGLALASVLTRHPVKRVVICEPTGLRLGWATGAGPVYAWRRPAWQPTPRGLSEASMPCTS